MSECKIFKGSKTVDGYGQIKVNGKLWRAHRWAWKEYHGSLSDEMDVLHYCDEPACINVEHMYLGFHATNMRDKANKGRLGGAAQQGEKHPSARLTEEVVRVIRDGVLPDKLWAQEYCVSVSTITNARNGKTWKHVE